MDKQSIIKVVDETIEKLESSIEICQRQLLINQELETILSTAHTQVLSALDNNSMPWRIYDRETNTRNQWKQSPPPGWEGEYVKANEYQKLTTRIDLLRRVSNEIEPEFLRTHPKEKNQTYFAEGNVYKPMKEVFTLLQGATSRLIVVDMYLDECIFDYIESLNASVEIRLLTGKRKPIFQSLYNALKRTRPNLYAKAFTGCHDRFFVIDNTTVWHLGASFNGFGKAAFMLNKVSDEAEQTRIMSDLDQWWSEGEDLTTPES